VPNLTGDLFEGKIRQKEHSQENGGVVSTGAKVRNFW
jgi:hypothetical protein